VVTGNGSPEHPYEIGTAAGGNPLDSLQMVNSPTVEWAQSGAGTVADKRRWIATAMVGMRELTDVSKTDVPVAGDVVQWNGSEWVFGTPGATAVPVSGVWGSPPLSIYGADSTKGREIYTDSNGVIRTKPIAFNAAAAGITASTPGSSYPVGYSVMRVLNSDNTAGSGWPLPAGTFGYVENLRALDSSNVVQVWHRDTASATAQAVWQRSYSGTTWLPWTWVGGNGPCYSARKTASQTMPTANTFYTLTYDASSIDEGGISYSSGVFTVPFPGKYQINWNQHFQVTGSPSLVINLYQNSLLAAAISNAGQSGNHNLNLSRLLRCVAGDTIKVQARSSVANTVAYGTSTPYSTFDITLLGG